MIDHEDVIKLEKLEKLLSDDRYSGSKDWRSGGLVERVEWLISMYEAKKEEVEYLEVAFAELNEEKKEEVEYLEGALAELKEL